jgi:hypothetical protein
MPFSVHKTQIGNGKPTVYKKEPGQLHENKWSTTYLLTMFIVIIIQCEISCLRLGPCIGINKQSTTYF